MPPYTVNIPTCRVICFPLFKLFWHLYNSEKKQQGLCWSSMSVFTRAHPLASQPWPRDSRMLSISARDGVIRRWGRCKRTSPGADLKLIWDEAPLWLPTEPVEGGPRQSRWRIPRPEEFSCVRSAQWWASSPNIFMTMRATNATYDHVNISVAPQCQGGESGSEFIHAFTLSKLQRPHGEANNWRGAKSIERQKEMGFGDSGPNPRVLPLKISNVL